MPLVSLRFLFLRIPLLLRRLLLRLLVEIISHWEEMTEDDSWSSLFLFVFLCCFYWIFFLVGKEKMQTAKRKQLNKTYLSNIIGNVWWNKYKTNYKCSNNTDIHTGMQIRQTCKYKYYALCKVLPVSSFCFDFQNHHNEWFNCFRLICIPFFLSLFFSFCFLIVYSIS